MPDEAVSAGHGCNEQSEAITLKGGDERRFNWPDHIAILVPRHESLVCLGEFHRDRQVVGVIRRGFQAARGIIAAGDDRLLAIQAGDQMNAVG